MRQMVGQQQRDGATRKVVEAACVDVLSAVTERPTPCGTMRTARGCRELVRTRAVCGRLCIARSSPWVERQAVGGSRSRKRPRCTGRTTITADGSIDGGESEGGNDGVPTASDHTGVAGAGADPLTSCGCDDATAAWMCSAPPPFRRGSSISINRSFQLRLRFCTDKTTTLAHPPTMLTPCLDAHPSAAGETSTMTSAGASGRVEDDHMIAARYRQPFLLSHSRRPDQAASKTQQIERHLADAVGDAPGWRQRSAQ